MLVEGDYGYTADYTVLLTLGEDSPAASYRITQGANSTWTQNTDPTLTVRANGELSKFTGVKVDGELIDEEHYTAVSGSTVITLQTDYLETLSVGTHKLTVVYSDGECSTNFKVKKATSGHTEFAEPSEPEETNEPAESDNPAKKQPGYRRRQQSSALVRADVRCLRRSVRGNHFQQKEKAFCKIKGDKKGIRRLWAIP